MARSNEDCTEVRGVTFSSDNNWPQVTHVNILQLIPRGGNAALPKITSTQPGQEAS